MLPQYDPSYKKTAVWLSGTGSLEALCPGTGGLLQKRSDDRNVKNQSDTGNIRKVYSGSMRWEIFRSL